MRAVSLIACMMLAGCAEGTEAPPTPSDGSGGAVTGAGDGDMPGGDDSDAGGDGDVAGDGDSVGDVAGDGDGDGDLVGDGAVTGGDRRKPLTIQGSQVPTAQNDFPVLVRITAAELQASADPSGLDIYFTGDDGSTLLPFERESYAASTGALVAWVKLDLTGGDQVIHVHYGDGETSEKSAPASVWASGYENVWHLTQDPGPGNAGAILDSTGAANATAHGSMTSGDLVDGPIGKGIDFDGSDDRLSYTNTFTGTGPSTVSAWVNQRNDGDNNSIISFGTPGSNQVRYLFATHDSTSTIRVGFNPNAINSDDGIEGAGWKLVTWVWSAGNTEVFLDGASVYGPVTHTGANTTGTGGRIGANVLDNVFLDATLDEVHVSTVARSAAWITTEYNNQRSGSMFLSVGPEE